MKAGVRKPTVDRPSLGRRALQRVLPVSLVLSVLFGTGCRGRAGSAPDPSSSGRPGLDAAVPPASDLPAEPNARIDALVRANLEAELALRPTEASWLGNHDYDDKLDDVRTDAQIREATRLRQLAEQLRAIGEEGLSPAARLDHRLLQRRTDAALHELSEMRPLERSPLFYVDIAQAGVDSIVSATAALDADALRSLNGRLWRMRALFDEARRNLRGSSPDLSVRRAIENAQALRAFLGDSLPRLAQAVPDARLLDDSRAASGDAGRALDEFVGWLQRDFLPRAHGELSLGPVRYWERLRLAEAMPGSIELLVPRVEAALRDTTHRLDEAGRAVLSAAGGAPRPSVEVARLIDDDHPKAEELLARAQAIADQLFASASKRSSTATSRERPLLPVPPLGLPRALEMPPQLVGFERVLWPLPLEPRAREPVLFIELVSRTASERARSEQLKAFNRPTMVVTLAHELLGHFLVGMRRRQAPTLMQRVSASVLLDEGFAHYVERLMLEDPAFNVDARVRFVVERTAQLRLARLLASLRFHALGARFDDLSRLFSEDIGLDDYQARKEVERVALDPLAGAEALGRLEIERLRADWQAANPTGSLGQFHEELLAHGGAPIELIRGEMLPAR